jgi:hypothetical protein
VTVCTAKIRPFPNPTELACELDAGHDNSHYGVVRNYAFQGSHTGISWEESDRRTFRGDWARCGIFTCILPLGHRGDHAL